MSTALYGKFQDGMAICRKFHKPDFFITFTCNSKWEEIQKELKEGQTAQDRPDLLYASKNVSQYMAKLCPEGWLKLKLLHMLEFKLPEEYSR